MNDTVFIGIDPGKQGGFASYDGEQIWAFKCPDNPQKMSDKLRVTQNNCMIEGNNLVAYIERVWAFRNSGTRQAFSFGVNYGMWLGCLGTLKIPYIEVIPKTWMGHFGDLPKDRQERKQTLKQIAQGLLPENKVTLATADAILIAKYAEETHYEQ